MKQARDLFLLSAIAYRQGKFEESATLYATAMTSEDADQFLSVLNEEQTITANSLLDVGKELDQNLEKSISTFADVLSNEYFYKAEDEPLRIPSLSEDGEDEDFEGDSDDVSSFPGEKIIPSSLSKSKPYTGKLIISPTLNSPIKVKNETV